jgi:hypothetical protein
MSKLISILVLASLTGCSYFDKAKADADGGASVSSGDSSTTTAATGTATTVVGNLVDKALSLVTDKPFEGEIAMNVTDSGKPPHAIMFDIKGQKMRFDMPSEAAAAGGGYAIYDASTKKITSVSDAKKMAFVIDMNQAPTGPGADPAMAKKPNIDKTGKTDTVAGYSCEIWNITEDSGDKGALCVAKGISFPKMPMGGRHNSSWMNDNADFFPLRMVMSDATGNEKSRMEVTKIEKKSIDDSKFDVPAGYKTQSMEDLMKGLGGGMGHRPMPH